MSIKGMIRSLFREGCFYPFPFYNLLWLNFLRKNTRRINRSIIGPTRYAVFDIHKTAKIYIKRNVLYGHKKYHSSKLETSLWMDKNSYLEIGSEKGGVCVFHGVDIQIFKGAKVRIGKCTINRGAQIICQEEVTIGDGCLISRDVIIRDNDGGHKVLVEGYKPTAPVYIGNNVWIGQGAFIMKGVNIGDGAIISARAWVVSDVKPGSMVMGDPARVVRKNVEWEV